MSGKKYQAAKAKIDYKKIYDLTSAIELIKEISSTKFVSSIDIAIKLNLDTSKSDQQLRGAISLPYYAGKAVKILALTDDVKAAKNAGADFAGGTDMIKEIQRGWLDFDVIVTEPKFMIELGKLGKVLGPHGLMPNIKNGTVGNDIAALVIDFKKGKQEYRTDTYGNIHLQVGKVDTETAKIIANINALIDIIKAKKPASVKGEYIQSIALSSTMGPAIKVLI